MSTGAEGMPWHHDLADVVPMRERAEDARHGWKGCKWRRWSAQRSSAERSSAERSSAERSSAERSPEVLVGVNGGDPLDVVWDEGERFRVGDVLERGRGGGEEERSEVR